MKTIASDSYNDVCEHDRLVYAAPTLNPAVHVYDTNTWNRIRSITTFISDDSFSLQTLRVTSNGFTQASWTKNCIHVMNGKLYQTHGIKGYASGYFDGQRLCSVESNDDRQVVDGGNDRMQLFHDNKWRVRPLQPQPFKPMSAVITPQALYFVTWGNKLLMYKIN